MELNEWFNKGLKLDEYIQTLDILKDGFTNIKENFILPEDTAFYNSVKDRELRVIVLAEPWCGHCMLNIPIFLQLAKQTDMNVRFILRDENLELMDQYLTDEKRIIPIFIIIDQAGSEVATWGPIATETKQFVDKLKESLPNKDAENYQDTFLEMIKYTTKQFSNDREIWSYSYNSIKQLLEESVS